MSIFDLIGMALKNLFKRKVRTFLTVLGVVIGTSSIIVMMSLGLAVNKAFEKELENLGDITIIQVWRPYGVMVKETSSSGGSVAVSDGGSSGTKELKLDDNAIAAFKKIPGVITATPIYETYVYAKSGKYVAGFQVRGIDLEAMPHMGYKLLEGRLPEEGESMTAVFGFNTPDYFYKPNNRIQNPDDTGVDIFKDKIQFSFDYRFIYPDRTESEDVKEIKPFTITPVGYVDTAGWPDDYYLTMSLADVKKIQKESNKYYQEQNGGGVHSGQPDASSDYDNAIVKCTNLDTVRKVNKILVDMGYPTYMKSEYIDNMQKQSKNMQNLLAAIGAVSMFVAAIGIANTMIMSIYERTREIGVMKVIGALLSDIRRLFLLEASILGLLGGGLGVLASYGISYVLNHFNIEFFKNMTSYMSQGSEVSLIPPWLCGVGMAFAALIGLISGYLPARRAMKINAIKAIRSE